MFQDSIALLFAILLFELLAAARLSHRILSRAIRPFSCAKSRAIVVGAGDKGEAAARYLGAGLNPKMILRGFVDDDPFKLHKVVRGYQILGSIDDIARLYERLGGFDEIVVTSHSIPEGRLQMLRDFADRNSIKLRRFSINVEAMIPMANSRAGVRESETE